jgi:hypothetical protein
MGGILNYYHRQPACMANLGLSTENDNATQRWPRNPRAFSLIPVAKPVEGRWEFLLPTTHPPVDVFSLTKWLPPVLALGRG